MSNEQTPCSPGHHIFPGVDPHEVIHAEDAPNDAPPARVVELAAACVRYVATAIRIPPDFTPETLSLVDHYVGESRKALSARPEALALTAGAVGAYLGEVIRRTHRCWWRADNTDPSGWRLEFEAVLLSFYPVQVAYALLSRAIRDDQASGLELEDSDRADVIDRLSQLPPVSDHEYMLPSTRLEVLDIVVEALMAKQESSDPLTKRCYRPADYESR